MIRLLIALLIFLVSCPSWAAITYVGGQTGSFAGQTADLDINFALTGGSDGTPASGDLVIITYCIASTLDHTLDIEDASAGNYTTLGTEGYISDTYDTNMRVAYKFMTGTPDTAFGLNSDSTASDAIAYTAHVFRGVHATPLEQAVQQGTGANTSVVNPGSITPTTAGAVVYVAGCGALATTRQGVYTSSDQTSFLSSAQDDTNAVNIGAGYIPWTSGAVSPATYGAGGTDNAEHSYAWMIVALAPAAESGGSAAPANAGAILLLLGQ